MDATRRQWTAKWIAWRSAVTTECGGCHLEDRACGAGMLLEAVSEEAS